MAVPIARGTLGVITLVCLAFVARAGSAVGSDDGTAAVPGVAGPDDDEVARVLALSDDVAWGEYLAGECAACHAPLPGDGAVPVIHGTDATDIARALIAYRSGARSNTTMRSVAGALDDEEVAVLAHYLAGAATP